MPRPLAVLLVPLTAMLLVVPARSSPSQCYVDSASARQMHYCPTEASPSSCAGQGILPDVSREWCARQCGAMGYPLYGTEAGHACFCDSRLTTPAALAPPSDCNSTCSGNSSETCGGVYRMWVGNSSGHKRTPLLPTADARYIPSGTFISNQSHSYACQPYCVVLANKPGSWVCVMTWNTASYIEGTPGEHMVAFSTEDYGATWSDFVPVTGYDPTSTRLVSAYGSIVSRVDDSRMFAVYIYNSANVSHLPGQAPRATFRADMLGEFAWSYSDDLGKSWSSENYRIPVAPTYIETVR